MPPTQEYAILLVDDHEIIRDVLKIYFESDDRFRVITEAENGLVALDLLKVQKFDLIITDLSMPMMDGITLTHTIKSDNPEQKIIALTVSSEHQDIEKLLAAGVNGYLLKSSSREEIFHAVDTVISGENYYSSEVTKVIISQMTSRDQSNRRPGTNVNLTDREKQILRLIVQEYSNQEIADLLKISARTVDAHKRNLLEKTNCKNLAGLAIYAVENGIR